jgi:hypothetical protein
MFVLNSEVTIGGFKFTGVNGVTIRRSMFKIAETAFISVPSISKILRHGKADSSGVITGSQFKEGDEVTITLGYNGDLNTEFKGFVKRVNTDMPLVIECEGYSWLLRRSTMNLFEKSISLKELLSEIVTYVESPYKIKVVCDLDITLSNAQLSNVNGVEALGKIAEYTDGAVTCFFIEPDTLWCDTIYSLYARGNGIPGAGAASYRPGYNALKENALNIRSIGDNPVSVTYCKKASAGSISMASSATNKNAKQVHKKILNHISDATALAKLANEKAYSLDYTGYDGRLMGFLQPYCRPGDNAYIKDSRYPERDGSYLVEGTEVVFGIKGARRIVEIGPKAEFSK